MPSIKGCLCYDVQVHQSKANGGESGNGKGKLQAPAFLTNGNGVHCHCDPFRTPLTCYTIGRDPSQLLKAFSMMSSPHCNSSSVITIGGAIRMHPEKTSRALIIALSPILIIRALNCFPNSTSARSLRRRSCTISIPAMRPLPRTSPMQANRLLRRSRPAWSFSPACRARITRALESRRTIERTFSPTAAGRGSFACVV